jgi:sugar phosphate isomerase/epimerase
LRIDGKICAMTAISRSLLATCWTSAGDARPARGDGVSPVPLRERIEAVAAAGWQGFGIGPADLRIAMDSTPLPELRAMFEDAGIEHIELEFLPDWWTEGERRAASDELRAFLFRAAEGLGATAIKVGGDPDGTPVDPDHLRAEFDALATEAGEHGTRVALESMPWGLLPTTGAAASVVRDVANPHGGLCIDIWHARRSGATDQELRECVTIEQLFVVELEDATAEVIGTMWDDSCDRRMWPGTGDLDVPGFIATLHELGWRGHWGVEMIAESHRMLPVPEALAGARAATLGCIDEAERLLGSSG